MKNTIRMSNIMGKIHYVNTYGIVEDSIVDGPGLRLAIFTQGCSHNCQGCHNPDSHEYDIGTDVHIEDIVNKIMLNPLLSGLTISGGEPFEQGENIYELCRLAKKNGINIWLWSGYTFEQLWKGSPDLYAPLILRECDVLIDGKYVEKQYNGDLEWRGSSNQRVIDLQRTINSGNIILYEEHQ